MSDVADIPVVEILFDRHARPVEPSQADQLLAEIGHRQTTDLLLFAHGWNNDLADARALYGELLQSLQDELAAARLPELADRRFAIAALFWPSKKFTDEELIPGGAASADASLRRQLDRLREPEGFAAAGDDGSGDATGDPEVALLDEAERLIDRLEDDEEAQSRFVAIVREFLPREDPDLEGEIPSALFDSEPSSLLHELGRRARPPRDLDFETGGAAGEGGFDPNGVGFDSSDDPGGRGAASAGGGGILGGARRLLNFATYYRMKRRAGEVGEGGVFELLERLRRERPALRLHLVGHSFGGRLVAAATRGPGSGEAGSQDETARIDTLTMLQAAFSHYGFASEWRPGRNGYFRPVLDRSRVRGPIVVTHTRNDRAVGLAYALASRLMRQVGASVGDETDKYGGIGRNGALRSAARTGRLLDGSQGAAGVYQLEPGVIHNLEATPFIVDHGDVAGRQVAHAILSAIAAVPPR